MDDVLAPFLPTYRYCPQISLFHLFCGFCWIFPCGVVEFYRGDKRPQPSKPDEPSLSVYGLLVSTDAHLHRAGRSRRA